MVDHEASPPQSSSFSSICSRKDGWKSPLCNVLLMLLNTWEGVGRQTLWHWILRVCQEKCFRLKVSPLLLHNSVSISIEYLCVFMSLSKQSHYNHGFITQTLTSCWLDDPSWMYFSLQRWGKGLTALHPGLSGRPPSSGGYFQGFGYLSLSKSWTEASGKTSHNPHPAPHIIFYNNTCTV